MCAKPNIDFQVLPDAYDAIGLLVDRDLSHMSLSDESIIFDCISRGEPEKIASSIATMNGKSGYAGRLSDNPLRQAQYMVVTGAAIACRIAVIRGVPSEIAYNLSDESIYKADRMTDVDDVYNIMIATLEQFAVLVKQANADTMLSRPVRRCIEYIQGHLYDKLDFSELADALHRNKRYLYILFKKETGQTITEYIAVERVHKAKQMLTSVKYTSKEIAMALGFCSQSHFISAFKQQTGMTPTQFANSLL